MNANETALLDPFEISTPDEATELTALTRALELAESFRLLLVCCNQIPQRERLMEEVRTRLPNLNIQTIFFRAPIQHLLDSIQQQLTTPLPDAVFVSGLEFSLPVATEAHATPLIANLNASRNSFGRILPCPVVLWVPEYVLTAIAQGAPDFFSIRSSAYFFAADLRELADFAHQVSVGSYWEAESLSQGEKQDRLAAIERLLEDYQFLPDEQRDFDTELKLMGQLGVLYFAQGAYDKALIYYQRALKLAENVGNIAGEAALLHAIGTVEQVRGNDEAALDYYERARKIAEEIGDVAGVSASLYQLGMVQQTRGNYEAALDYYQRALKMEEDRGDAAGVAVSLHQLGTLEYLRGNYEAALDYYQRALKMAEEVGNVAGVAQSLHQLGILQQARGNYEMALDYYQRALKILQEIGNVAGVASSQAQIGQLLAETGRYAEAFRWMLNALLMFLQLESPNKRLAANNLKTLRGNWAGFDAAWREATGEDVPKWLLQDEGTKA